MPLSKRSRSLSETDYVSFCQEMRAQSLASGRPPPRPEGAKDVSPGPRPGMGRSVPFLPILKPRRGVTQPPMSHPHAMGSILKPCVAPLRGLSFYSNGRSDPGLRPGLGCFAPLGRAPRTQAVTHGCRKDTALCGSGFSRDSAPRLHPFLAEDLPKAFSEGPKTRWKMASTCFR